MAIIGAFTFRNDGQGCLSSKYLNDKVTTPYPKSCKKIGSDNNYPNDPFCGRYDTVWIEANKTERCELTITKRNTDVYALEWKNKFRGEGMLSEGMLIGWYKSI